MTILKKTDLNKIAEGICLRCGGPLIDIDVDLSGFDKATAVYECENCMAAFTAKFDLVHIETRET